MRKATVPRTVMVPAGRQNAVPEKRLVTLRYFQQVALTPAVAGVPGVQVFRANSLYDPDATGAGGQPQAFDQYMAFYNTYTVVGAKITVVPLVSSAASASGVAGIQLRLDSVASTDVKQYIEGPYCVWSGQKTWTEGSPLVLGFSAKKHLSIVNPLDDTAVQGNAGANPATGAYWHVFYTGPTTAATGGTMNFQVLIEYTAILTDPKDLANS